MRRGLEIAALITSMTQNRQPSGQRTGGQFASHARPDGTIDLEAVAADAERASEAAFRSQVRADIANARLIAATIRHHHPEAKTVVLAESDQEGCSWDMEGLFDHHGDPIDFDEELSDSLTSEFWDLPTESRDADHPEYYGWLEPGPNRTRHNPDMRFDIDAALATNPEIS